MVWEILWGGEIDIGPTADITAVVGCEYVGHTPVDILIHNNCGLYVINLQLLEVFGKVHSNAARVSQLKLRALKSEDLIFDVV